MKTMKSLFAILFTIYGLSSNAQYYLNFAEYHSTSGGMGAGIVTNGFGGNTFYGYKSGSSCEENGEKFRACTFLGHEAGMSAKYTDSDVFIGYQAGHKAITTSYNIFVGNFAGFHNNSEYGSNVMIGHGAGVKNDKGWGNVFLGHQSGGDSSGSRNVFLGANSGKNETRDNRLHISTTADKPSLIYGDFEQYKVGIGGFNDFPNTAGEVDVRKYALYVKRGILTEEVRIAKEGSWVWPDYVFKSDYSLLTLEDVASFIAKNGHLPDVPSAENVQKNGIELGDMARLQMQKIEELTLYAIEQNRINQQQAEEIATLKKMVEELAAKK